MNGSWALWDMVWGGLFGFVGLRSLGSPRVFQGFGEVVGLETLYPKSWTQNRKKFCEEGGLVKYP